ncbi:MAG: prepilin-type N-terminal cleavage/methylation domain-containing protein [Planctomycetales bacterium]|nr:prepilin-type N-terminal cleavage/methylation domain-containing protein [Planctomycetales bacterium]
MWFTAQQQRDQRNGLTLLELLLVLSLIVVVSALALPKITQISSQRRLQAGGEQVIAAWMRARNTAMRTGQTQSFIALPDSGVFAVAAAESTLSDGSGYASLLQQLNDAATYGLASISSNGTPGPPLSSGVAGTASGLPSPPKIQQLSDLILFVSDTASMSSGSFASATAMPSAVPGGSANGELVVLFYPDGTTSTTSLTLVNDRNSSVTVSLRGLTGTPTLGEVLNNANVANVGSLTP